MTKELVLAPVHYASVSGGKDSLFMLNLILNLPEKYPLDMVVHFELENEWDWVRKVVDCMEEKCINAGIKFIRIRPRKTWNELYVQNDVPTRQIRWCNWNYKLDCKIQLNEWIASQNCRPVAYIGLCADEQNRFKYDIGDWKNQDVCYPLAEEGICEDEILSWARNVSLFDGWYKVFDRQGCKICPCASRLEMAYLYKYYPMEYNDWKHKIALYEKKYNTFYYDKPIEEIDRIIRTKWLNTLNDKEQYYQMTIFDL